MRPELRAVSQEQLGPHLIQRKQQLAQWQGAFEREQQSRPKG
jgi:hypothetical protein